jgi:two-component sensor histidine kinase
VPLIAAASIYTLSSEIFGRIDAYPPVETIATIWIWLLQLSLFGSLYLEIRSSRDHIRTALSLDSEQTLIDKKVRIALARFTNREFANLLHGQVQNQLLALALQLEAGLSDEDEARRRVLDIMAVAHNQMSKTADPNVMSRLQELVEQWRAFAKISIDSDFEINQLPADKRRLVVQVVEESVTNAIRHGLANRVEVRLRRDGEKLRVSVQDNGLGPRTGKPGLGSELFEAASPNSWKISMRPEGGAVLHLSL